MYVLSNACGILPGEMDRLELRDLDTFVCTLSTVGRSCGALPKVLVSSGAVHMGLPAC